jgi:hypothetical protein
MPCQEEQCENGVCIKCIDNLSEGEENENGLGEPTSKAKGMAVSKILTSQASKFQR